MRAARPAPPTFIPLAVPQEPAPAKRIHEDFLSAENYLFVPDTQCRPGIDLSYMRWLGCYVAAKRPAKVIHAGDHFDFPSLSSYDRGTGKKSFEGRRYSLDLKAGIAGMDLFFEPIYVEKERCLSEGIEWDCDFHFTDGNHCDRVTRAIDKQPELDGVISLADRKLESYGWTVHPFLEPYLLGGVVFCHYVVSGVMGRPITSARAILTKLHHSVVVGHQQTLDVAMSYNATGKPLTAVIAGCAYPHDEAYLAPQINIGSWRGVVMLYGVSDGVFTPNPVSLAYLKSRFEGR